MASHRFFLRLLIGTCVSMACLGQTEFALNLGSDKSGSWQNHAFEGIGCPEQTQCHALNAVYGSDQPDVFQTYSEGTVSLTQSVPNGNYDVTLFFAEPRFHRIGERVFDVHIQGERVLKDIDVLKYRDGQIHSALTVTIPNQTVRDGLLHLMLKPVIGQPILSGVLLETKAGRATPRDQWILVWQDLFDESGLNPDHWSMDIWPPGKVNDEDQAYTDSSQNLRVENGALVLEAHHHPGQVPAFTSARIHTRGKHDFLYGRVEVTAQLPDAQGTWPAIWLLPSDPFFYATNCEAGVDWQGNGDCDAWPNSGEIDLMEHVGFESGHIHGTVHTRANYWVNGQQRKGRLVEPSATKDFHVYAMEWTPDRIDLFVNDIRYFSYLRGDKDSWHRWPFDQPFHLILNLAVGGNWGRAGGPIAAHEFPQRMLVDSVRVYRRPR